MKNFKRFTAAIAATLMAASLSVPMASSAGSIKIGDPAAGYTGDSATHTYDAYQIFSGTLSNTTLSDITWGTGVNKDDDSFSEIYTDLKNKNNAFSKDQATDEGETTKIALSSASEIADILSGNENDAQIAKDFADVVAKYLSTTKTEIKGSDAVEVDDGYYLIQDAPNSPSATDASKTRYILKVAGDAEINAKSDYPTVVKKVKENSDVSDYKHPKLPETASADADYNDIADYNIGDAVPFKLYGTLPSNYDDYKQYYYCFNDTLGSEFNLPSKKTDVTVKIDGTVTNDFDLKITDRTMTIKFENLKTTNATKDSVITVEYTAVLNTNAKIGAPGQVNGVNLTYSNNPNQESGGTPDTSTTTDDGVIVFTYGVDINKYTGNINNKLAGAKFAIYKEDENGKKIYLKWGTQGGIVGIHELDAKPTDEQIAAATTSVAGQGIWLSNDSSDIKIEGLDAGTYYIEELAAPAGYNKLAKDIKVVVTPTYMSERQDWTYSASGQTQTTGDNVALTNLSITANDENARDVSVNSGKGTIDIENKSGSTLPSTGGMGTKLFFLGGGSMVAVAGIFLITKKRMGKNAE